MSYAPDFPHGNYSWNHRDLTRRLANEIRNEIRLYSPIQSGWTMYFLRQRVMLAATLKFVGSGKVGRCSTNHSQQLRHPCSQHGERAVGFRGSISAW
jgi:hypothetical protein